MAQAPLLLDSDPYMFRDPSAVVKPLSSSADDGEVGPKKNDATDLEKPDDQAAVNEEVASIQQPDQAISKQPLGGDWDKAKRFLTENPEADIITQVNLNGMTILHVAANMGHTVFIKKLVQSGLFPKEAMRLLDNNGWTALHYAATFGNLTAIKLLVSQDNSLTQVVDKTNRAPILQATNNAANKRSIWYLAKKTTNDPPPGCASGAGPFSGDTGAYLINGLAAVAYYDICLYLLNRYPELSNYLLNEYGADLLVALVRSSDQFPSGSKLTFWERCIYHFIPTEIPVSVKGNLESPQVQGSSTIGSKLTTVIHWIFGATSKVIVYVPSFKYIRDVKYKHKCIMELLEITCKTMSEWDANEIMTYFQTRSVLYEAAKDGAIEIIRALIKHVPHYMDSNYTEVNILLCAVRNRRENVFNLMMERGVTVKLLPDYASVEDRETMLHATAKLAPYTRILSVSSPALQMQRELQWFQGVEKFVRPALKTYVNVGGQTGRELFTIEHKELAQDAERWLKDTSNSCLVVSTLIITVVFAAAFTIPGGNIDGTGIPLFLNQSYFMVFIVSDAVGMFSSATSILMFLSILTARYAEDDFLRPLPKRLILGLVSLLIAIASMMVAFGVALYIVLHPKFKWIIFPIIGLTSIPVGLFILLQLPLFIYMVRSTYGPSILKPMKTPS